MDVWFDSGLVWGCGRYEHLPADLIVEGNDQFRGWFQSLVLTSLALEVRVNLAMYSESFSPVYFLVKYFQKYSDAEMHFFGDKLPP